MRILIPILIGAIIGYITNWLAIKMLFRPYYGKKIFGIKVPFTPGLIPKESKRIAKSTGESVANYLITPESLTKAIESDRIDENIRSSIEFSIRKIKDSENTIKTFLNSFGKDSFDSLSIFIESKLVEFIIKKFRNIETKEKLKEAFQYILINEFTNLSNDNRKLEEILSENIIRKLKLSIVDNKREILKSFKEILNNPTAKYKIKKAIENAAVDNIPRILITLITPQRISEKVYEALLGQLSNANAGDDIVYGINKIIEKVLESPLSQIMQYIEGEDIRSLSIKIINNIYSFDNDNLYFIVEGGLKSIIHNTVEDLGNKPIKDLLKNIDEDSIENIVIIVKNLLQRVAINKLPSVVESLNISKIVEDQINSFDVSYIEELILEISSKELKAITWLGALLGGAIGILSPLLQNL